MHSIGVVKYYVSELIIYLHLLQNKNIFRVH